MKPKKFGRLLKIPVLGIGTAGIGGLYEKDTSKDWESVNAIRTAIELGITHIDTAEIYGAGHAEELVGRAIKGFDRKKLFITTKVSKDNLAYNKVIDAANGSLRRLGIKYIDLYLIHWPNTKVPLKETMTAMDFLVEKRIIRFIGVSNFTEKLLKEAQSCTKNKILANEVEYNLLKRGPEKKLLEYCQKNGIILIAYQPVAGGKLAKGGFKVLDEIAKKYNKTQAQIAINWLVSKPNVVTIPKAASIKHIKENIGALGWKLDDKDTENLDKYFQRVSFFSDLLINPLVNIKRKVYDSLSPKQLETLGPLYDKIMGFIARLRKALLQLVPSGGY
jgi:diketogulonate reductase-like aldo/keto reductase